MISLLPRRLDFYWVRRLLLAGRSNPEVCRRNRFNSRAARCLAAGVFAHAVLCFVVGKSLGASAALNPKRDCFGCGGGFGHTTNEDHVGPRPRSAPPGATCLAPLDTTQSHPPPLHGRGCDCGRSTATEERAISIETLNPKP